MADFLSRTTTLVERLGGRMDIHALRTSETVLDTVARPYDGMAVERFHRALVQTDRVFARFRTGSLGKVSPVHLFWGSFDLAVTRFSGRKAPLPVPGGAAETGSSTG